MALRIMVRWLLDHVNKSRGFEVTAKMRPDVIVAVYSLHHRPDSMPIAAKSDVQVKLLLQDTIDPFSDGIVVRTARFSHADRYFVSLQ